MRAVSGACELIWVEGPDAGGFLQGLLTNDITALAVGGSCHALMLDSTGHIRADMRVARTAGDEFTLVVEPGRGAALVALLDEFHFSEDVDLIGPEPFAMVTVVGEPPHDLVGTDLRLPGRIPGTVDLVGVDGAALIGAAGAAPADAGVVEALRIAAGIPRFGVDHTDAHLVQEAALEADAVSFDKGCYLGQETVARIRYRGQVNRRLRGILLDAVTPAGGSVLLGDRPVGTLTSVAQHPEFGSIGLAIVRREAPDGAVVTVGEAGTTGRLTSLPFKKSS